MSILSDIMQDLTDSEIKRRYQKCKIFIMLGFVIIIIGIIGIQLSRSGFFNLMFMRYVTDVCMGISILLCGISASMIIAGLLTLNRLAKLEDKSR